MKLTVLALALIAVILVACKREATDTAPPAAVVFEGSGVSLVPGGDWKQTGRASFAGAAAPPGVCLPTLAGKAGLIQVLLLPADRSDPTNAAAGVRAAFDANPNSIKDSFRQESLTVQSGAEVIYVAYKQQAEGESPEGRSYNYIVKNRGGRGVAINYVTSARADSDTVQQMIRQTLKVE